jgi:hypothetical protein
MKNIISKPWFEVVQNPSVLEGVRNLLSNCRYTDVIEGAIHHIELEQCHDELSRWGIESRYAHEDLTFGYICVYPPDDSTPGVWATPSEVRRLLDTLANIPDISEAFRRWEPKIQPLDADLPPTAGEAEEASQEEIALLRQDLHDGAITSQEYSLFAAAARKWWRKLAREV